MKKILTACLALVMVMTMSITVFAAPGGFLSSPSGKLAPDLVDYSNSSDDCEAELVLTPYANRGSLPDPLRINFESAYNSIANTNNISNLNSDLTKIVQELNLSSDDLGISDFFNIHSKNCDIHEDHGAFTIKLKPETLENFVALMRYDGEKWVIVEGAKILSDGMHLTFASKELGPFSIVVNTADSKLTDTDSPQTGDSFPWIYVILIAVSVAGLAVVAVLYTKSKKA